MGKKRESEALNDLREEYPQFEKYIPSLNTRQQFIIRERLKHKTLQEIGEICPRSEMVGGGVGLTRARIREIEQKAVRKLRNYCYHSH